MEITLRKWWENRSRPGLFCKWVAHLNLHRFWYFTRGLGHFLLILSLFSVYLEDSKKGKILEVIITLKSWRWFYTNFYRQLQEFSISSPFLLFAHSALPQPAQHKYFVWQVFRTRFAIWCDPQMVWSVRKLYTILQLNSEIFQLRLFYYCLKW